ncbi:tRNA lysidine(34) synthetase TilS [Winogradskyella sp. PG-2]|uniref:tRNA lysidine(34) synthetase TilS n=1 Tax=Winogradskyella sp. PG-2 TaxID=754409 RepID=UPI000458947B|nr:tRNA lysidine(34) synthetase TilS [Winogradskyella sp. PG-2]BAO77650.1 tRNA(Ile)-lysidine synthetase [Winogradskyella sp. PG-2]
MREAFNHHIKNKLPFLKENRLVIAISGGIDSVVLTYLCKTSNINFALAHCNFNLRGEESNGDEEFVIDLAEQLEVEVFIQSFDTQTYADENKLSIQMAARELRYNWFAELAIQLQFDYILTAHQADDNIETFLINFMRGTGLNGLTGIPIINQNIVRPLLPFSRDELMLYAIHEEINWREDSSNSSRKYLRNKLRHEVIPILKEVNPNLLNNFRKTVDNLGDTFSIVEDSIKLLEKKATISHDKNAITYKISKFKKMNNPKAYMFEIFKGFGFTEWNDLVGLLNAQSGKHVLSNTHRLVKHREHLILTELSSSVHSEESLLVKEINESINIPIGRLKFELVKTITTASKYEIYIDKDKLKFPLELRLWKKGDYFHPLGMKGKKKISKYLKDEKLSLVEKESVWVLTSEGNIVWVIGKRADNRFRVKDKTIDILKIELS